MAWVNPPIATGLSVRSGETVWLVKVTGLYLTTNGWLSGGPTKGAIFRDRSEAFQFAKKHQPNWLGRVRVVRRTGPIRDPQW